MLYAFTLGRESRLSLAELVALFGRSSYQSHMDEVALFSLDIPRDEMRRLFLQIGGSIRVIEILGETSRERFPTDALSYLRSHHTDGKNTFALGSVGAEMQLQSMGLRIKKTLTEKNISARLINQWNETIKSAVWKSEKLGKKWAEIMYISLAPHGQRRKSEARISQKQEFQGRETFAKWAYMEVSVPQEDFQCDTVAKGHQAKSFSDKEIRSFSENRGEYLGLTIACQDIDSYARRDTSKARDMQVGMLPPKLAQMMINLTRAQSESRKVFDGRSKVSQKQEFRGRETFAKWAYMEVSDQAKSFSDKEIRSFSETWGIYDPFCGLGTVLIEAIQMGYTQILGSDLSPEMVRSTRQSIDDFVRVEREWHEKIRARGSTPNKDLDSLQSEVLQLDAREIGSSRLHLDSYSIVSEGYLGEVMNRDSITMDRVGAERKKLAHLYERFFGGLKKIGYSGTIVMSFPFWDVRGTTVYLSEVFEILEKYGFQTIPLLDESFTGSTSRKWTLLYKRPGQQVGREIWRGRLR